MDKIEIFIQTMDGRGPGGGPYYIARLESGMTKNGLPVLGADVGTGENPWYAARDLLSEIIQKSLKNQGEKVI